MIKKLFATLTIVFTSVLAQARPEVVASPRPEVVFSPVIEVSNLSMIKMLEAAELKGFSRVAFQELSQMNLWDASEPAESKKEITLTRSEISKKLRDLIASSDNLKNSNVAFKIPEQVKMNFAPTVSKSAIERALMNTLKSKCSDCVYRLQISALPIVKSNSWAIDYDQEIRNGSFMLPVQDAQSFTKHWVTGSLQTKKTVPVLKKTVRFGERLQADDIELMQTDITFLKEDPPTVSEVEGFIATRTLQARTPVTRSDFKREPAARKGQILKAFIGTEAFEVSINATAEENGAIGDTIKIQNPETRKVMSAVVLDKGVVRVL